MPKRTALAGRHGSLSRPAIPRKVYQAFLVRVETESEFLKTGSKSGLGPLGKIAAEIWLDLEVEGVKSGALVFRPTELEGILLIAGSAEPLR